MAELERALFRGTLPQTPPADFTRLYFGAEFCFWRLPAQKEILQALSWARQSGWDFTLVTPVLGEAEMLLLDRLLAPVLPELAAGDEVLISDWGALEVVRSHRDDLPVILGRALSGQKRGPRILGMELTTEQEDYFSQGSWYNRFAVEILTEQRIVRVEQDNLLQGLAPLPEPLTGSLHWPSAMVTSSRNCPFRDVEQNHPCPAPCGELFSLQADDTDIMLYQDGNTQFLCNEQLPENLPALRIDRLVWHPEHAVCFDNAGSGC
mgnify:CR=1 FL=1